LSKSQCVRVTGAETDPRVDPNESTGVYLGIRSRVGSIFSHRRRPEVEFETTRV